MFFCRRVVKIWNNLPLAVDFTTLVKLKRCLLQADLSSTYCIVLISKVVFQEVLYRAILSLPAMFLLHTAMYLMLKCLACQC